jgi:hypothetical protein
MAISGDNCWDIRFWLNENAIKFINSTTNPIAAIWGLAKLFTIAWDNIYDVGARVAKTLPRRLGGMALNMLDGAGIAIAIVTWGMIKAHKGLGVHIFLAGTASGYPYLSSFAWSYGM